MFGDMLKEVFLSKYMRLKPNDKMSLLFSQHRRKVMLGESEAYASCTYTIMGSRISLG